MKHAYFFITPQPNLASTQAIEHLPFWVHESMNLAFVCPDRALESQLEELTASYVQALNDKRVIEVRPAQP